MAIIASDHPTCTQSTHTTTPPAPPTGTCVAALSWDDFAAGTFPPAPERITWAEAAAGARTRLQQAAQVAQVAARADATLTPVPTNPELAPEPISRRIFREALHTVADTARAALPESHGRIDKAIAIVLAGDVELLEDGHARVASQGQTGVVYRTVNGACDCKDYPQAPQGFCKHRLAYGLYKRTVALAKERMLALDAPQTLPAPVVAAPLPEAPASANVHLMIGRWRVQLTLRDTDEARLLERLTALMAQFPEDEPAADTPPPAAPVPPPAPSAPVEPPEGWCAIHQVVMPLQTNERGSWRSHRLPDGSWCRGKKKGTK